MQPENRPSHPFSPTKVETGHRLKSVALMTNFVRCHTITLFRSTNKVRCIRKGKAELFVCHFSGKYTFYLFEYYRK